MQITEKVSPMHPDKVADRIAGALVDYCYKQQENPKCAFEVLIGHKHCFITGETSVDIPGEFVYETVERISKEEFDDIKYIQVPQDVCLSKNQNELRCGDNGVFAGYPMPRIHHDALVICKDLYNKHPYDGKIIIDENTPEVTVCWSNTTEGQVKELVPEATKINPIGPWKGGTDVDTGITGRKLASDFYGIKHPLGGGTLHGKDLSKADCSVNIYCYLEAQRTLQPIEAVCSIGDKEVNVNGNRVPFANIVKVAKEYIDEIGGFEKLAEWGLREV